MKKKQEMIYDFMVALSANPNVIKPVDDDDEISPNLYDAIGSDLYDFASEIVEIYFERELL